MPREMCRCGHHKATHHAETQSSGDVTQQVRRVVYGVCLGPFCECPRYHSDEAGKD